MIVEKILIVVLSFLSLPFLTISQNLNQESFITFNTNLYIPQGNVNKGVYPIIWYDKTTKPKLLIGGFGVGITRIIPLSTQFILRGQLDLSKHTYWDEPIIITDQYNVPIGNFTGGSSDFTIGFTSILHYHFSQSISLGTGIGAHLLLISLSRLPEPNSAGGSYQSGTSFGVNKFYKKLSPMLPIELSFKKNRYLYNLRYEQGLINRLRNDLSDNKKDYGSILYFEMGIRLN